MKKGLFILCISICPFLLFAQENKKDAKGGAIEFKQRERIKTKAQIQKELQEKEIEVFLKEVDTKVFLDDDVEISANFKDGEEALYKFIAENLDPNVPLAAEAPAGKYQVFVNFVVMKDGTIKDIKSKTSFGYGMETEAERVIKKSNKRWVPAQLRGKEVMCEKEIILTFSIL